MTSIYVPSRGPKDWRRLLADPEKHWRSGYSACTLAHAWEAANGLPTEIAGLIQQFAEPDEVELLIAIPEHKVPLPGGKRPSQTDLFALIRAGDRTISTAIEGKVAESFGPLLVDWRASRLSEPSSNGGQERLSYICNLLGLREPLPDDVYYQLLHRTASAIIEAKRFGTTDAAMIVHSFSPVHAGFEAFSRFAELMGHSVGKPGCLVTAKLPSGVPLHLGWASGDGRFLATGG